MAQTSGSGGLSPLAMGGIASVVVIVGGVVLMQLGVFDRGEGPDEAASRTVVQPEVTVSPAAKEPVGVTTTVDTANSAAEPETATAPESAPEPATDAPQQAAAEDAAPAAVEETAEAEAEIIAPTEAPEAPAETAAVVETAEPTETGKSETAVVQAPEAEVPAADESDTVADTPKADVADTATEEAAVSEDPATTAEAPVEEAAPLLEAPTLDLVRVDPDGALVVAGRAQAGAAVEVLLDGTVLEQTEVQGSGDFVIFSSILPSDQPRVISLLARFEDQKQPSEDQFILAPISAAPEPQVADAEDAAKPKAEPAAVSEDTAAPQSEEAVEVAQVETSEAVSQEQSTEQSGAPAPVAAEGEVQPVVAETTTPQVEAETAAPEQPVEAEAAQVEVATAEGETGTVGPDDTTPPQSEPVADETLASAETVPAPQPEPTAVAVLRAGADGVELVQPATPVLNGKVVLDTISYSDSGEVLLAGRGRADALVRVYVDNALKTEFLVAEDGRWGGALAAVEPGIYTLRLDEISASGEEVLSRLETPFKREAPEVLQPQTQQPGQAPDQPVPLVRAITVQKGDTLWAISQERYGSGFLYVRVFQANQDAIRDPDLIYPGQVFNLPD
ncbi:MAG: LysM peptidoglycan-binding domain-containing protein [Pseudophaeobacter sp. bin_em_oilr2.035]|uniref:LysM peptidoglycan-binding domain-containing protein n=1 Tax=Phaeobacter gallaeciensis TaxID=60890 RepID=A0ABD4X764_9RHOB|nr:LysM peptidoglycan-binding domain-containing protein [Phaeobacter gallaeciensis]MDF1771231.1 LysM peptidoglycan-binding domain-containing protein [Pseudophaeobacter sp. bin_em_oilr2.035]MDE4143839.1 LysM peptidoglycan-binding domain-containing protein [Phaeobacter gallaeciensis]MDE4155799.1 LysM peptidoglycan-binding domain-containing protein [Phaeobacter gallaeciensis]MDE4159987.1 LysM peptidoglycan-binding domain-containing protein [Phaeobacter gallaeciensis]MDE4164919.1 LysM peptidoglyca